MLSHAKIVIISNYKKKFHTKQLGNQKWVSIIQNICTNGWAIFPYIIIKNKCYFFFDISTVNFSTFEEFIQTKTIGLQIK